MKTETVLLVFLIAFSGIAYAQGASTNLETQVMKTEPAPLQAGEYADIWIRMTNTGDAEAQNPSIALVDEFPFQASDKSEWNITGGLDSLESYDIHAQVKVNENAVFGNNSLKIRKTSGDISITERIPLEVRTDDRSLIISNLDFPQKVEPGSTGKMKLTFENMANSNFRNIDVTLDVSEIPVAPRETSRKRIPSIGPEESRNVEFNLDIDAEAENQLYKLPIQIDYQNQAGQELSVTETTGVNVGGFPNIGVDIDESDIRSSGNRGTVTFRVINKGEGQARFVEVQLKESQQYEIISEDSIYLGSMIADDYQTAEFDLYVKEEVEDLKMPVNVEYRDGEGDQSAKFNVDRELYSSGELNRYGINQSRNILIPAVIVLVLVVAGVYYWRRKRE